MGNLVRVVFALAAAFLVSACAGTNRSVTVTVAASPEASPRPPEASTCPVEIDRSRDSSDVEPSLGPGTGPSIVDAPGDLPAIQKVLLVPVPGGVVRHVLGTMGNPECDDSFRPTVRQHPADRGQNGILEVSFSREQMRLAAVHAADLLPCEDVGAGDCALRCVNENTKRTHVFVDQATGQRLLRIELVADPLPAPQVSVALDGGRRIVAIDGGGCHETIPLM
jgi:hypothetical protein